MIVVIVPLIPIRFHLVADIIRLDARCSNMIYELTKSKENLTAGQEQLRTQFNNLTGEMEALQKQYDSVVASRDRLQEEFDRLNPRSNVTGRKSESPGGAFFFFFFLQSLGRLCSALVVQFLPCWT